jgi:hypothetical protein
MTYLVGSIGPSPVIEAFSNGPKIVCASHLSPEDGNRSSPRNAVFLKILDEGQSPKTQ